MSESGDVFDVVIVGGGPGGLQATLTLARARKRVLLVDGGARRNAAAVHVHNFVTRDGTPPDEFRGIAREQLATYPKVAIRDERVESITGERGAFQVALGSGTVVARRVLLATGLVDEMLPIDGFRELWGRAIFQCPYCHGWEVQDRRWGYLVLPSSVAHLQLFALMMRGWTREVTVFTNGAVEVPGETKAAFAAAGIAIEESAIVRLVPRAGLAGLQVVELAGGKTVPLDVLFVHPPQKQVDLVRQLGLALDGDGYVQVDPMKRETSVAGIYASGDLTTRQQAAVFAAASGMQAAAVINAELTAEGVGTQ